MTDLRERVARAICCPDGCRFQSSYCAAELVTTKADAAIRLVLDEAAKVADDEAARQMEEEKRTGGQLTGEGSALEIAAAIRALGEK